MLDDAPNRNLGMKVAALYLLVDTKLLQNSAFAVGLLSAITRSPDSTSSSFFHGHFHLRRRLGAFSLVVDVDGADPGNCADPEKGWEPGGG